MVFENLTLFEVHLDDAQFGPRSIGTDADDTAEPEPTEPETAGEGGGKGRLVGILGMALVASVGAIILARRIRSESEPSIEIEEFEDEQSA